MAEVVGLVLGVAAALVPAYQGFQKCNSIIAETRGFPRNFRTFKQSLLIQKGIFSNECELLLKDFVLDNATLQKMLKDQDHDQWKDLDFQTALCSYLGEDSLEDKLAPFKTIRETLDEITHEVLELEQKVETGPNPVSSRLMPLAGASRRLRILGHKLDWSLSKKAKLENLVDTLRKQNRDLFQLRSQRSQGEAKIKPRDMPQKPQITPRSPEYVVIQEVSTKLYKALAGAAACRCHSVNLRLDSQPRTSYTAADPLQSHSSNASPYGRFNFRFVLSTESTEMGQSILQDGCTCLLVESGPGAMRVLADDSDPGGKSKKSVMPFEKAAGTHGKPGGRIGKKVQFGAEPSKVGVESSSLVKSVDALQLGPVITTPPQNVLGVIEDLCAFLKKSDIKIENSKCLGYVKSDDSYSHLVYKDLPETSPASRISLSCILSSLNFPEKQRLLPRGDRLKLGLALSLSVLYFGSYTTSWFKERWRSQDIYFFGNQQRQGILSIGSPHVVTSFSSLRGNELLDPSSANDDNQYIQKPGTTLARNEQLFSLAVVLIEIAYGDLLCNIFERGDQRKGESQKLDEFAEYLKAKTISDFIGGEMGKKYADVVRRCLFCDFGIDENDLSKRKLQEAFFTNVVCELERCVQEFSV